jgi:hypothetical protein
VKEISDHEFAINSKYCKNFYSTGACNKNGVIYAYYIKHRE